MVAAKKKRAGERPSPRPHPRERRFTLFLTDPQATVFSRANARALVRERVPTTILRLALAGLRAEHPDLWAELEGNPGASPP